MNNYEKLLYKSKRQKRQLSILGHKINLYKKQLEAYENMRKEIITYIDVNLKIQGNRNNILCCNANDLLNILSKVGEDNE